jgi:hypothetical protein
MQIRTRRVIPKLKASEASGAGSFYQEISLLNFNQLWSK